MTFDEYVLARGVALTRFARLLTGDEHRAEDLVQDVLAKAYVNWRRIASVDRPTSMSAGCWSTRISPGGAGSPVDPVPVMRSGEYPRPLKAGANRVWADPGKKSWTMIVGGVYFDIWSSGRPGTFSVPEVLAAATTVQVVPDIENPAAW